MALFRRDFLRHSLLIPFLLKHTEDWMPIKMLHKKIRANENGWPSDKVWEEFGKSLSGKLIRLDEQYAEAHWKNQSETATQYHNPYYLADDPAFTQNRGWFGAWESKASEYAIKTKDPKDFALAVKFAAKHHLRIVVKGGGHSYQGTSSSEDSLLIWTKDLKQINILDAFIPQGAPKNIGSVQAVEIGAGVIWGEAYEAVTTKVKRYVQGGGCMTVGVAGLIQSGGFGSFSKAFGIAAASLLEAEIVLASGETLVVNAYQHQDIFWGLKGGGGGTFGIVTKLMLQTHVLPTYFGSVTGELKVNTESDCKLLLELFFRFYKAKLHNPNWGEQIIIDNNYAFKIKLVFQGLTKKDVEDIWSPFWEKVTTEIPHLKWIQPFHVAAVPAQYLWSSDFLRKYAPDVIGFDQREGASSKNIFWKGDTEETGQWLYGYHSVWLPEILLTSDGISFLSKQLVEASTKWTVSLHFNKGLSGANEKEKQAALQTAINPVVVESFALAIVSGGYHAENFLDRPDASKANLAAASMQEAFGIIQKLAPKGGSYLSESNFFDQEWQSNFWGSANYKRLIKLKWKYDPHGLFFVHHGVGSEVWSQDGFTPLI